MTPTERARARKKRLREQFTEATRALARREAQDRATLRKVLARRRQRVGTLADEAGLFLWHDDTLEVLFQLLARLIETPDPVKVLDRLLAVEGFTIEVGGLHGVLPSSPGGDIA